MIVVIIAIIIIDRFNSPKISLTANNRSLKSNFGVLGEWFNK